MTSTEVPVPIDRFAGTLRVDRSPDQYPDYRNPADGIWAPNDLYPWCREPSPASGTRGRGENGVCSRPTGHPGQHVASTSTRIIAIWEDATPAALEPDPMGHVTRGARTLEIDGWNDPRIGVYNDSVSRWCNEPSPPGQGGVCSRPSGHPVHWNHIAGTSVTVLGVWGPNVDKWSEIRAGDYVSDYRNSQDPESGFRSTEQDNWCRHGNPDDTSSCVCTRPTGHSGQHIATTGSGRVRWVLANANAPVAVVTPELIDPEDGSPADDESLVFTAAPVLGDVVKLRDRLNRLYVMGVRAASSEIEALDLTRNELRAIPVDRCVKIADESVSMLTLEELEQIAKWYADHRDTVRRVAVREYRADRWCMEGLNRNLKSLGLSHYQPTLRGEIMVRVPFEHPDAHVDTDLIQRRVTEALRNPEVAAAMRLALPVVEDIELNPDGLTVSAGSFVRK